MITVAFTVTGRRQAYLRETLASWSKVRGVQDTQLLFSFEPWREHNFPFADFKQWAGGEFGHVRFEVNDRRLGCKENTRAAMDRAFSGGAEFAVLAEEDVVVSADVLEYVTWCAREFEGDSRTIAVCAHALKSEVNEPGSVVRAPWFNPLIWGTWPGQWEGFLVPHVWGAEQEDSQAWDGQLRTAILRRQKLCAYPVLSRSSHIGRVSTLTPEPFQSTFFEQAKSRCFSGDYSVKEYQEVSFEREDLGLLV